VSREGIRALLLGGNRRSIGRSAEAAARAAADPARFAELMHCLWDRDPLIAMRAADAAEKVTRTHPAALEAFKAELLGLLAETQQAELRWHLAVMVPRLRLSARQRRDAAAVLRNYLLDCSSIVKTFALQGLFDLARGDKGMRPAVTEILRTAARAGTAAMRARARRLLGEVERKG
jgi:hypothetical protein